MSDLVTAKRRFDFLLSMPLCAGVILVAYAFMGCFLFGDNTIAHGDAVAQYLPLLTELKANILSGELSYSFANGLGANFFSTATYYLFSPFSLLALLIPRLSTGAVFDLIILLKVSVCAATFSYYIKKSLGKFDISVVIFSICFALCGFVSSYCMNIMWLDALIYLPLIALGVERITNAQSGVLYCVSLALAILSCFYTGYILCIFSVLYFFIRLIGCNSFLDGYGEDKSSEVTAQEAEDVISDTEGGEATQSVPVEADELSTEITANIADEIAEEDDEYDGPRLITVLGKFAAYSLLAGAIAAVALLPVLLALQSAYIKSGIHGDQTPGILNSILSMFAGTNYLVNTSKNISGVSLPNLYTGIIALLTVPAFIFVKKIPLKERITYSVFVVLLLASVYIPQLNIIWHGFSEPAGFPHRFLFLFSFLIAVLAYRVFTNLRSVPLFVFPCLGVAGIAVCIYAAYSSSSRISNSFIIVSATAFAVYTALIILLRQSKKGTAPITILVLLLVCAELGASFTGGRVLTDETEFLIPERDAIAQTKELTEDGLYRSEIFDSEHSFKLNGSMYGFNGITCFSSLLDEVLTYTVGNMGVIHNQMNAVLYKEQTPLFNALFGIKYFYTFNTPPVDTRMLTQLSPISADSAGLWENEYALPFLFATNKEISEWDAPFAHLFDSQNEFFAGATGIEELYTAKKPSSMKGINGKLASAYGTSTGKEVLDLSDLSDYYELTFDDGIFSSSAEFTITQTDENPLYIFYSSDSLNSFFVNAEGYSQEYYITGGLTSYIIPLPNVGAGGTVTLTAKLYGDTEDYDEDATAVYNSLTHAYIQLHICSMDEQKFIEGFDYLNSGAIQIDEYNNSHIKGTINVGEDQTIFTSIPYDKGWSVYIDSEPVQTICHKSHLMQIDAEPGEHTIELKYTVPGLKIGAAVSLGAILLLVAAAFIEKKLQEKKANNEN